MNTGFPYVHQIHLSKGFFFIPDESAIKKDDLNKSIKNEMELTGYFTYETVSLLYLIYRVTFRFLKIRNGHFLHLDTDFLRCIALI